MSSHSGRCPVWPTHLKKNQVQAKFLTRTSEAFLLISWRNCQVQKLKIFNAKFSSLLGKSDQNKVQNVKIKCCWSHYPCPLDCSYCRLSFVSLLSLFSNIDLRFEWRTICPGLWFYDSIKIYNFIEPPPPITSSLSLWHLSLGSLNLEALSLESLCLWGLPLGIFFSLSRCVYSCANTYFS